MNFTSDNSHGAAPGIIEAMARANDGALGSYGADPLTARVEGRLREIFETDLRVFLVTTGTAANALALASVSPPWGTVFCHHGAHIAEDECGAPEFYGGGLTLRHLPGKDAKIDPDALAASVAECGARGVHQTQPAAVSITNLTERGALYSPEETAALADIAHANGCAVHLDGTRFANAVVAGGHSPADLSWRAGVDILCLGATKNGALAAEAVIYFDPERQAAAISSFEFRRKRGGHLVSKGRMISAQMDAWLEGDFWLDRAGQSNAMGQRLLEGLRRVDGVGILNDAAANILFARLPLTVHRRLRAAGAAYYLDPAAQTEEGDGTSVGVRLVCSPSTVAGDVDAFLGHCTGNPAEMTA